MSAEDINKKCKALSKSSPYKFDDIFYYIAYKRMHSIENLLNETQLKDFKQPITKVFKNVDEQLKSINTIEHYIYTELSYFDIKGYINR